MAQMAVHNLEPLPGGAHGWKEPLSTQGALSESRVMGKATGFRSCYRTLLASIPLDKFSPFHNLHTCRVHTQPLAEQIAHTAKSQYIINPPLLLS